MDTVRYFYSLESSNLPLKIDVYSKCRHEFGKKQITVNLPDSESGYVNIFHLKDYNNVNFSITRMINKLIIATDPSRSNMIPEKEIAFLRCNDRLYKIKIKFEEYADCMEAIFSSDIVVGSDKKVYYKRDESILIDCEIDFGQQ